MAFQVLVTEIANEDLAGLVRYIARDNPAAAERFGLALLEKLKLLHEHPLLGRVVPERGEPNLREIIHQPYRIVYRVREREQVVEVLRFWHGARGKIEIGK
jgi:plasmid stabilization system protein ParE